MSKGAQGARLHGQYRQHGRSLLAQAAAEGHDDVTMELLCAKADVNECGSDGRTPLAWAALNGHCNIVELLIEVRADMNNVGHGRTALAEAVAGGSVGVISLLARLSGMQE